MTCVEMSSNAFISVQLEVPNVQRLCKGAHLEVFSDHVKRDLENRFKDLGHLRQHAVLQLVDNGCNQAEDLRIPANMTRAKFGMPLPVCYVDSCEWGEDSG